MSQDNLAANLLREEDGSCTAVYGPFKLRSAFQPIFRRHGADALRLHAFEGLIRASKAGSRCSPFAFFSAVPAEDRSAVDALCRELHLRNVGQLNRPDAAVFLNFDPSLFDNAAKTATEADRVEKFAYAIGLTPDRVVCEITEKSASNRAALLAVVEDLRDRGFRIAVDDYGTEDSDQERIQLLRPDIVKYDGAWVLRYMERPSGVELLRHSTTRFRDRGIVTLFEGLEQPWQVDLAQSLRVDLMQGYALARPEELPTRFNALFPPDGVPKPITIDGPVPVVDDPVSHPQLRPGAQNKPEPPSVTPLSVGPRPKPFGRRGT